MTAHPRTAAVTGARHRGQYYAQRQRAIAYGRWQRKVAAQPVRNHIVALHAAGMTHAQIAAQAGLPEWRIKQVRYRTLATISADTATAIRGIRIHRALADPGTAPVPAIGSTRRLQALTAAGWPLRTINARQRICDTGYLRAILHGRVPRVSARLSARIAVAYDQLWDQNPADHGARGYDIHTAHRMAADHRWAPPMAWDDDEIDDPDAVADWTGRCGSTGGYYDHTVLGTPTCQPCRDAVAVAAADRKLRRRQRATAPEPTPSPATS
ncbi:hypothetical protein ACWGB8_01590 [Kitasatospora sp. NPDC054939]